MGRNITLLQLKRSSHDRKHRGLDGHAHRRSLEQRPHALALQRGNEHLAEGRLYRRALGRLHAGLNHIHGRH